MKKLTGILCMLALLISASSFTPSEDDNVSTKIKSSFEKTFSSTSDVYWKKVNGFYIVNFKINEQDLAAAYNEDGELVSATRHISLSQLPMNISLALENKYEGYTISNLVTELTTDGQSSYYIKAENPKNILTIKATAGGELMTESKIKK